MVSTVFNTQLSQSLVFLVFLSPMSVISSLPQQSFSKSYLVLFMQPFTLISCISMYSNSYFFKHLPPNLMGMFIILLTLPKFSSEHYSFKDLRSLLTPFKYYSQSLKFLFFTVTYQNHRPGLACFCDQF